MQPPATIMINGAAVPLLGTDELTPERGPTPKRRTLPDPPPAHSLRDQCPPVRQQGSWDTCCAHALAAALEFLHKKNHGEEIRFSPLFLHYVSREQAGLLGAEGGVPAAVSYMAVEHIGVCLDHLWPYGGDKERLDTKPPDEAYEDAARRQGVSSKKHDTLREIKWSIAEGFPVRLQFGIAASVADANGQRSITNRTGVFPVPSQEDVQVGAHAVLAVGYDDGEQVVIIQNSWGTEFGDQGFGKLPYAFFGPDQDNYMPTSSCPTGDAMSFRHHG